MPSTFSRIQTLHRAALVIFSLTAALACSLTSTQAYAADGPQYGSIGQYGEVTHFGGFDTTAYNNEQYGGALTAGEFLNPVGFAVDTQDKTAGGDGTALYVLDRVGDWGDELTGSTPTEWRLQKLSDTGTVLGSTEFTLPNPSGAASALGVNNPTGVLGLAIDDKTGTIYTLIYGTTGSGNSATPEAEEIIGWSTTVPTSGPNSGQLIAPGSKLDSLSTPVSGSSAPEVFSTSNQLESSPLYDPQGLALDVTGGQDYLAIEADGTVRASNGSPQGPTVVEQVSPGSGAEIANWLSTSLLSGVNNSSGIPDANATAAGISTAPDGNLDVLLNTTIGGSVLDAVDVPADLSDTPTVLASSDIDPGNADGAPLVVADSSGNRVSAGPQAIALSNGLYASDFYENTGGAGYFDQGANEGIRLVSPTPGGVLAFPSTPASSTIFDTLGNATSGGACNIGSLAGSDGVSLAPGANGTVWVLTAGQDSSAAPSAGADGPYITGRQVIEFSPGKGSSCAEPTGTFDLNGQAATSALKVNAGATVDFDTSKLVYPGSIFAYEWDPTGSGSFTTVSNALTVGGFQPAVNTAGYQYTTPGVYSPQLDVLGDFGEYQETGSVTVLASSPPAAAFSAPATAQSGQSVSFDASQSRAASGAQISNYHWSFGDGTTDDTQSATDTHTYATAGTYTVTLTVRDNDTQSSTPASQTITISNPPSGGGGNNGGGGTITTPTTTTTASTGPPTATIDRSATNVSPEAVESGSNVVVTVTCPATKVSCAGTAQVKTASAVAASAGKSARAKKKVLVLGQATFSLTGGKRETLTIKISSTGAALLKRSKRLKVLVVVSAHDSYGDPGSKTLTLTLTTPSKKK
jgi:PKD repeat protein